MRINKEYEERREEIISTAKKLFYTKGYDSCTVNDILREISIAKGTFYYYFKSKEEVMDAIVAQNRDKIMDRVNGIKMNEELSPEDKLLSVFMAMNISEEEEQGIEELHKPGNALLHQKVLNQMVTSLAPILAEVISEGIEKKIWKCEYPLGYMEIFLAAALTLTDEGIFEVDEKAQQNIMIALISLLEKMLEVESNHFLNRFFQEMNR